MGCRFLSHSQNSGVIFGRPLLTKMESLFSSFIPGHQRLLFIPGHQRPLVFTRSSTFFVYTRASSDSLLIPGEASYSHQWPGCGGHFLGRYNADERFLGRLREWCLGERDPCLWDGSGQRVVSSHPVSGMSGYPLLFYSVCPVLYRQNW